MPTAEVAIEPTAYAAFPDLARAIDSYLRPDVEALLGIRQLVPAEAAAPPAGHVCPRCGAIRDERGRILPMTGIREGDRLTCATCDAMSPSGERRAKSHGKPIRIKDRVKPASPPKLTAKDRKAIGRKPAGFTWVAMHDAEQAGDVVLAGKLQTLLYRLEYGQIHEGTLALVLGQMFPESVWARGPGAVSA